MSRKSWRQTSRTWQFQKCWSLYYAVWAFIRSVYSNCASKSQTRHIVMTYGYHECIYNFGTSPCAQWDGIGSTVHFRKGLIGFPVSDVIRVLHKPQNFWEKLSEDTQKDYRWHSTCSLYIVSSSEKETWRRGRKYFFLCVASLLEFMSNLREMLFDESR